MLVVKRSLPVPRTKSVGSLLSMSRIRASYVLGDCPIVFKYLNLRFVFLGWWCLIAMQSLSTSFIICQISPRKNLCGTLWLPEKLCLWSRPGYGRSGRESIQSGIEALQRCGFFVLDSITNALCAYRVEGVCLAVWCASLPIPFDNLFDKKWPICLYSLFI